MRIGVLAVLVAWSWRAPAQSLMTVASTTDGNGLFSYTFSPGIDPLIWQMEVGAGTIAIPSHGVLGYTTPEGWTARVDQNETVVWERVGASILLGQPPLTFSIRSSFTQSVVYDGPVGSEPNPSGVIIGVVYFLPDYQRGEGGFQWFSFIGPQSIPEPSSFALFGLAALFTGPTRKLLTAAK
jgi:hypothetical protein